MKYLISIFLLIPCAAYAQQGIQNVHEVANSTGSITQTEIICSSGPYRAAGGTNTGVVDVANNTSSGTLSGYFGIEVYNLTASTNSLACGFDLMLSTTSGSVWYGREVPAGVGLYWAVQAGRKLYCATLNPTGCTYATVTQLK